MILKVISANSVDPDQTAPEQSDLSPHCLPVCKNRFEKFAKIFSRRHKQTTFSDACFLGALRVKTASIICRTDNSEKEWFCTLDPEYSLIVRCRVTKYPYFICKQ